MIIATDTFSVGRNGSQKNVISLCRELVLIVSKRHRPFEEEIATSLPLCVGFVKNMRKMLITFSAIVTLLLKFGIVWVDGARPALCSCFLSKTFSVSIKRLGWTRRRRRFLKVWFLSRAGACGEPGMTKDSLTEPFRGRRSFKMWSPLVSCGLEIELKVARLVG